MLKVMFEIKQGGRLESDKIYWNITDFWRNIKELHKECKNVSNETFTFEGTYEKTSE